jgi:xanthine/uracil permease
MATVPDARTAVRYPLRTRRRPLLIAAVAVVAAIGLGWLLWAAYEHADPAVSGDIHVFSIPSAQKVTFTLTVQRRDPSVPVSCAVIAQASNFETVGQKTINVPGATTSLVDLPEELRTIRQATSVSVSQCWTDS